jgi:hypothetical protein
MLLKIFNFQLLFLLSLLPCCCLTNYTIDIVTKDMELASEMVSLLGKELKSVWFNMRLGVLNGMSGMTGAHAGITTCSK